MPVRPGTAWSHPLPFRSRAKWRSWIFSPGVHGLPLPGSLARAFRGEGEGEEGRSVFGGVSLCEAGLLPEGAYGWYRRGGDGMVSGVVAWCCGVGR